MNVMKRMYEGAKKFVKNGMGQTVVEYALLLALIAVVAILAIRVVGEKSRNTYQNVGTQLGTPAP